MKGLRRSSRDKKKPRSFSLKTTGAISKKRAKKTPRRSPRLKYFNDQSKCTQKLTCSTMLTHASSDEKSNEAVKESVNIGRSSSVERLLETGFFEGIPITCFSEELGVVI